MPVHLQSTEPQALVTVLPQALLHFGRSQQLPAVHALPAPQSALQALLPQVLLSVTPHWVPHVGSAQQVSAAVSHSLPLPQDAVPHVREPHVFVSVTLHWPLQTGKSQHVPATAPVAFLQVCAPQVLHESVPPQPSSKVPHWPG